MKIIPPDEHTIFDELHFCDLRTSDFPLFQEAHTVDPAFDFLEVLLSSDAFDEHLKKIFRSYHDYKVSEITYWLAKEIAAIISRYVTHVQKSVIELLKYLPEFKDFDETAALKNLPK